ncbi:MAG: tyrosine-type recombinase/integrase [Bacillota bacterium]|nr:tyrosine-type recombinase/integrase [Bacillota bacterium]
MIINKNAPALLQGYLNYALTIKALSPKTVQCYERDIMLFFKYLIMATHEYRMLENVTDERVHDEMTEERITSVTRDDIYGFLFYIADDRASSVQTRKRRLSGLSNFYKYLKFEEHLIEDVPTDNIPQPKAEKHTPKYLVADEWERLLDTAHANSRFPERDVCILTFALNLGLRRSELEGINTSDVKISRERSYIHIRGKGNKERDIPLNDSCISAYENYIEKRILAKYESAGPALFISKQGKRMDGNTICKMIKKFALMAGLDPEITTHSLRHTFATNTVRIPGAAIDQVQVLMGHESIATTSIYRHVSNEGLDDIIKNNPANQPHQYELDIDEEKK